MKLLRRSSIGAAFVEATHVGVLSVAPRFGFGYRGEGVLVSFLCADFDTAGVSCASSFPAHCAPLGFHHSIAKRPNMSSSSRVAPSKVGRRTQSSSEVASKRTKLSSQFEQMAAMEEEKRRTADMTWVMTAMLEDPANVQVAKQAIIGRQQKADANDRGEAEWYPASYVYMYKIPRDRCIQKTLPLLHTKFDRMSLDLLKKADKRIDQKLILFAIGTHRLQKLWHHKKDEFDRLLKVRSEFVRSPLNAFTWHDDGSVDWPTVGVYRLFPPIPENTLPKDWTFTHCVCIYLPEDMQKASPVLSSAVHGMLRRSSWVFSEV